ncbi:MAG: PAS domain S-box protein [Candidatus Thorarchaeota archaeon]
MFRVLFVDDEEDYLAIGKQFLKDEDPNIELTTANSAQEALQKLAEEKFDAIVADYVMPDMNGLELLAKLRSEGNNIPFIMFTGQGREEVAMQALNLGADYYLMKGGDFESQYGELAHIIRQTVRHRQTEEALRASTDRFIELANLLPQPIFEADLEGKFTFANRAALETFGYTQQELSNGLNVLEVFVPRERERVIENMRRKFRGEKLGEEGRHYTALRKDGNTFPALIYTDIIVHESKTTGLRGLLIDNTEQEETEIALRESEEKYRNLVERANDGILIIQDGKIAFINKQVTNIFGRTAEEIINTPFAKYLPPESLGELTKRYQQRMTGEDIPRIYETVVLRHDGTRAPIEVNAGLIQYQSRPADLVIVRDISERKEKELALRESEERYRSLVETSPEGITLAQLDGTIVLINQQGARILGYGNPSELIGRNAFEFIVPEEQAQAMANFKKMLTIGTISNIEYTCLRKDGTKFSVAVNATVIKDEDGQPSHVIGMSRDITGQKGIERELRESEKKYRSILANIEDGYFEVDLAGNFTFFNDVISKTLGYGKDELINMNYRQYMDAETAKAVYKTFNTVFRTKNPIRLFDWEITRKDGKKLLVEASVSPILGSTGDPTGFQGIVRDITSRRQADEALRESEQRYRELVEKMEEGVVVEDSEGCFTFVNLRFAEMLGYRQEELIGQHWTNIVPEIEKEKVREEAAKRPQGISSSYETLLERKDGQFISVIVHAAPLFSSMPDFQGVLVVFTDITNRKLAEEQLKRQKEELSEFVHTMAHDLRNSLHNIRGYAKLLEKKYNPAHAAKITDLVKKITELLERSVALADAGRVIEKGESIELSALIQHIADSAIPENISFILDPLPQVIGDRVKVAQIFENLFVNAVVHGMPKRIEVSGKMIDNDLNILICDDGKPIPPQYRSDVFRHGFSTKETGGGRGLLLVQKLVEAHGWRIYLEESLHTTFRIVIPMDI